jgi:type IV pilus assembly protein PilO
MDLSEIRDLDFNNIGSASTGVKAIVLGFLAVLILVGGYFYIVKDKRETLDEREQVERQLKEEFETKQQKAANLPASEQQLAEMREMLEVMLRQLPSRTEMPELLIDISQTALGAGIDNELFEP